jgi:ABC-type antimicrobial peptide transport system permease subunit
MAVLERTREFGLLRALGMKPGWIVEEVLTESFLLLVMGMFLGNCLGILFSAALSYTGINLSMLAGGAKTFGLPRVIYPVLLMPDAVLANVVVFVLGLLVSAYPAVKASRFTPVEAMART